jgi:Tfp pilus assembly protein PilN
MDELTASWDALTGSAAAPSAVSVVGSSTELPDVPSQLSARLRVQAEWFDVGRLIAGSRMRFDHPARAVCGLGLALQGAGMARWPLNLLAHAQIQQRSTRLRSVMLVMIGLCALAMCAFGLSGMMEVRRRQLAALRALEQQERQYQTLRPEVRGALQQQDRIQRRAGQLDQLVRAAPVLTQVLGQISYALPEDAWLTKVEIGRAAGIEGMLEGRAKSSRSVTQFLDRLRSTAGMTTVEPLARTVTVDEASQSELIAFTLRLERHAAVEPAATDTGTAEPPAAAKPRKPARTRTRTNTAP